MKWIHLSEVRTWYLHTCHFTKEEPSLRGFIRYAKSLFRKDFFTGYIHRKRINKL
jgi:hypothetical protein